MKDVSKKILILAGFMTVLLSACTDRIWNNPYPAENGNETTYYSGFSSPPKHLDPARSYSANEAVFTGQIYEPPLQYNYLKRPYQLEPLTLTHMPKVAYLDASGQVLSNKEAQDISRIATTVYTLEIKKGIMYQPHPAFFQDDNGNYLHHHLTAEQLDKVFTLSDIQPMATRELIAEDYVYQIKRLAHPSVHSPILGLMSAYIEGLQEFSKVLQAEKNTKEIDLDRYALSGVQVLDRYRYQIRIKGKYPQFLYWLAMPFFAPLPVEAERFYSQEGLREKNIKLDWYPVGTGPFMMTENNPYSRIILMKNPNFHGEIFPQTGMKGDAEQGFLKNAGKALPLLDKAVYSLEKESIPYWSKFLQGYYDASGISSDSFDQVVQFSAEGDAELKGDIQARGIRLKTAVATSSYYMGFNMLDSVVGGDSDRARKLRQAISIAVDYEEYIAIFRNGRGIAAQGPLPPGIFGYIEGEQGVNPVAYQWQYQRYQRLSLDKAKALLREAGYPNGQDPKTNKALVLHLDTTGSGPDDKAVLNWWRKQYAKLGIDLDIRSTDYNRFQDKMTSGNAQIFQWGWNADYPDPENFLFLLYGPNSKAEFGGENAANYQNAEFDRLFKIMKSMDNTPERQKIINQMIAIAREDAPWLWGWHPKSFGLSHAWMGVTKPNMMANNTLKYVSIDTELRRKKQKEWNPIVLWPIGLLAFIIALSIIPAWRMYRHKLDIAPMQKRNTQGESC